MGSRLEPHPPVISMLQSSIPTLISEQDCIGYSSLLVSPFGFVLVLVYCVLPDLTQPSSLRGRTSLASMRNTYYLNLITCMFMSHVAEIILNPINFSDTVGATLHSDNWHKMAVAVISALAKIETQLPKRQPHCPISPLLPPPCQDLHHASRRSWISCLHVVLL